MLQTSIHHLVSTGNGSLRTLKEQLAVILQKSDPEFEVQLSDVQHQVEGSNCSVFAITCTRPTSCILSEDVRTLLFPFAPRQRQLRILIAKEKVPVYCRHM